MKARAAIVVAVGTIAEMTVSFTKIASVMQVCCSLFAGWLLNVPATC